MEIKAESGDIPENEITFNNEPEDFNKKHLFVLDRTASQIEQKSLEQRDKELREILIKI